MGTSPMSNRLKRAARVLSPWLAVALFAVGAYFVVRTVRREGVDDLWRAIGSVRSTDVLAAGAYAAASYLTLTFFDHLGVRTASPTRLSYPKVAFTSFTALSLGHTVGMAALSSGAVRYRLYSHFGLTGVEVARVVLFSAATVAAGLAAIVGVSGLLRAEALADFAGVPTWVVESVAVAALAGLVVYVVMAARAEGSVRVLGHRHPMPSAGVALLQVAIGSTNYLLIAAAIHRLLGDSIDASFLSFASYYAAAMVLAIVSHVPGGVGVLEGLVLSAFPGVESLSALIVYRLLYHLAPFALGCVAYALFELLRRRRGHAEGARLPR